MPPHFSPDSPLDVKYIRNGGDVVLRFMARGDAYLLKIFRSRQHANPLMPAASESAQKEAWVAGVRELKPYIPEIWHEGRVDLGGEVVSYFVQDYADLTTAAAGVRTTREAVELSVSLGHFCSVLHSVKAVGFGSVFIGGQGRFSFESWEGYVAHRLKCSGVELFSKGGEIAKELQDRISLNSACGEATLFHHDLLHNWSNVLLNKGGVGLKYVIDWNQCGAGRALVVELGVARFALRNRSDSGFGWKEFLINFLEGYGLSLDAYRSDFLRDVNLFSMLYAFRSAQLFPHLGRGFVDYINEAFRSELC